MTTITRILAEALATLSRADLFWVGVGFLLYAASLLCAGARWRVVVRAVGGTVGWWHATLATVAGVFINNVTPTGRLGGEACRIAVTRLRGTLTIARGALATLCDRLSDIPPVLLLFTLALPVLHRYLSSHLNVVALVLAVLVIATLLVGRWLRSTLRAWMSTWRAELHGAGLPARDLALGFSYSALIWIEDLARLLVVGLAFDVRFSVPQAAALSVIAVAANFAPTVGGLGAVEGGLMGGLALFGVPIETAIAITTVERLISYGFSTVTGGITVALLGGRRLLQLPAQRHATSTNTSSRPL